MSGHVRHELGGCIPILCTPFDEGDKVDLGSLRSQIDWVIGQGATGVATLALASEGYKLTEDERTIVAQTVIEHVGGRVPVVVSADGPGTAVAVDRARRMAKLGADALMVLPPSFVKPSRAALADYYLGIADVVDVPIMIQDAPQLTGVAMSPDFWVELAEGAPTIQYVKAEGTPQGPTITGTIGRSAGRLHVFCGWGGLGVLDALDRGAVGSMPAANFTPEFSAIHAAWNRGQSEAAGQHLAESFEFMVWAMQSLDHSVRTAKRELMRRGVIASDRCRHPRIDLDDIDLARLDRFIDDRMTRAAN